MSPRARTRRLLAVPFRSSRPNGLPNVPALLWFPALVLLLAILGIATGLNGWSSGQFRAELTASRDPQLVLGEPRIIRTDEWNTQTPWGISQVEQGLPDRNRTFPYGMDTTIPQDLPSRDWTMVFRPHLWGFLFLDVNRAFAAKWWILAASLVIAVYLLAVSIIPRAPSVAALVAISFYFSPFFQWWYLPTTIWPVVWSALTVTALEWAARAHRPGFVLPLAVGLTTVTTGMTLYPPFIVPCAIVVVAYFVARFGTALRSGSGRRDTIRRFLPVLVALVAGAGVVVVWLVGRRAVVAALLGTVYPGQRSVPTGSGGMKDLAQALGASFSQALSAGGLLGANSSEASTFVFVGLVLVPGAVVLAIRRRSGRISVDTLAVMVAVLILVAFCYLPGWDALARVLQLDRTLPARVRLGVGLASILLLVLFVRDLREDPEARRPVVIASAAAVVAFVLSQVAIAAALQRAASPALETAWAWWIVTGIVASAVICFSLGRSVVGAIAFLIASLLVSLWVNPVYQGVFDLRTTAVGRSVARIDGQEPGTWVGVGGRLTTGVLVESGVRAYNGFQGAPSRRMWAQIDPRSAYADEWNRLGGISWTSGAGEPAVSNPAPDRILVTFDSCSVFAQRRVSYVLGDEASLAGQRCLMRVARFSAVAGDLAIYRVIRTGASSATR